MSGSSRLFSILFSSEELAHAYVANPQQADHVSILLAYSGFQNLVSLFQGGLFYALYGLIIESNLEADLQLVR